MKRNVEGLGHEIPRGVSARNGSRRNRAGAECSLVGIQRKGRTLEDVFVEAVAADRGGVE